ncbi:hypothetical protein [Collinsella aerofaciens]|uniref:hypothetical protein n=1 Tax=Collinsella aerofaciens TaxID=74426 RepID=UPI003D7A120B
MRFHRQHRYNVPYGHKDDRFSKDYDSWDEDKETRLHDSLMDSGHKFMVSSWGSNDYRSNGLIRTLWSDCHVCSANHAYIVNGKHKPVVEVLLTNYSVA